MRLELHFDHHVRLSLINRLSDGGRCTATEQKRDQSADNLWNVAHESILSSILGIRYMDNRLFVLDRLIVFWPPRRVFMRPKRLNLVPASRCCGVKSSL